MHPAYILAQPTPEQQLALSIEFRALRAAKSDGLTAFEAFVQGRLGTQLTAVTRNEDEISLLTQGMK